MFKIVWAQRSFISSNDYLPSNSSSIKKMNFYEHLSVTRFEYTAIIVFVLDIHQ